MMALESGVPDLLRAPHALAHDNCVFPPTPHNNMGTSAAQVGGVGRHRLT